MPPRKTLALVCLILTTLSLAIGNALVGQWIGCAAASLALIPGLLASRWRSTELFTIVLVVSVALAALGLFAGAAPVLMLLAAAFALAHWDLAFLERDLAGSASEKAITPLEKKHYRSLGLVIGLALLAVLAGRIVRFQIPFIVALLLAALAFFSLERMWRTLSD
jgi:hypothetical protein